jgi:hypothetical protein
LPESAEIRDRRLRMEHGRELVRLGRVPGYRGPVQELISWMLVCRLRGDNG